MLKSYFYLAVAIDSIISNLLSGTEPERKYLEFIKSIDKGKVKLYEEVQHTSGFALCCDNTKSEAIFDENMQVAVWLLNNMEGKTPYMTVTGEVIDEFEPDFE